MLSSLAIDVAATRCPERFTWQQHNLDLGVVLGSGRFATVRAIQLSQRAPGEALPATSLQGLPPLAAKIVEGGHASHEAALLRTFDHPHILRCFGLVQLCRYELILVERCAGELFERVQSMDSLDECQAARWMLELISAVEHCHAHGVVHRDIKPENILLRTVDAISPLVLSDFGGAKRLVGVLHSPCGSRGYVAPETVTSLAAASQRSGAGYGTAADMWSCGIVAHVLLTGTLPTRAVYAACATEAWPSNLRAALAEEEALVGVSDVAVDFLDALLRPQGSRLSASNSLSHGWLASQPGLASRAAAPTRPLCPLCPLATASPLLRTPKRLRETALAARDDFREGFREGAPRRASVAEIPQAELPPPAFMRSKVGRSLASSARSFSAASGLDLLGLEPFSRKRAFDAGLPIIPQTPSTAACTPTGIIADAVPAASATRVAATPEPQLKRARSISACLKDLLFQEPGRGTDAHEHESRPESDDIGP